MNTRFSSLVALKKNKMEQSERLVQRANADLNTASSQLQASYNSLEDVSIPDTGNISAFLASRELLSTARRSIQHNQKWVEFTKEQVHLAREKLKSDMIEHEKFKHLELVEIKKILLEQKRQEAKDLDEVALMTYTKNSSKKG
ncbi:MAG: flagellar export protein FliJ [Sulfurimonas sp.]|nr:flagellar export protein FliJ [Sulfurimonas sp.]MDD5203344.1 flagellar export protein FliJ [Sulfurimonas sp.]